MTQMRRDTRLINMVIVGILVIFLMIEVPLLVASIKHTSKVTSYVPKPAKVTITCPKCGAKLPVIIKHER